jgi:hypothetical protein
VRPVSADLTVAVTHLARAATGAAARRIALLVELGLNDASRVGLQMSEWIAQGDWRLFFLHRDRVAAYRRVLGYGSAPVPVGSRANTEFHGLFSHFINQVALYWRDKRVSDVIRERAYAPGLDGSARP